MVRPYFAAGGAAPVGATLDTDGVAGEAHQDWGEGRAPFPEDRLSDGGSSSAERVVPDDFGTDWTVEIIARNVRMKDSDVKPTEPRKRCLRMGWKSA